MERAWNDPRNNSKQGSNNIKHSGDVDTVSPERVSIRHYLFSSASRLLWVSRISPVIPQLLS